MTSKTSYCDPVAAGEKNKRNERDNLCLVKVMTLNFMLEQGSSREAINNIYSCSGATTIYINGKS